MKKRARMLFAAAAIVTVCVATMSFTYSEPAGGIKVVLDNDCKAPKEVKIKSKSGKTRTYTVEGGAEKTVYLMPGDVIFKGGKSTVTVDGKSC